MRRYLVKDENSYRAVFLPLWSGMVLFTAALLVHDLTAAWFIARSGGSNATIALVQAAASLPFFLIALPAGALADLVDRGRIIIWVALLLTGLSLALAFSVAAGIATIPLVLAASLVFGCGSALFAPTWQAIAPEVVTPKQMPNALALSSLGVNIARSMGPFLGGIMLWLGGAPAGFVFNAVLLLAVVSVFWARYPKASTPRRVENFGHLLSDGLRYVRYDKGLQTVALRAACYFFLVSVQVALLPALVRDGLGGDGLMLGLLVAAVGVGAIGAFLTLTRLRKLGLDRLMMLNGLCAAILLVAMPLAPSPILLAIVLAGLGFTWLVSFSSIHIAAQMRLPAWVRARGSAIYMMAIHGSLALGSVLFGFLADWIGLTYTYAVAGAGLAATSIIGRALPISVSGPYAQGASLILPNGDGQGGPAGPVVLTIAYQPSVGGSGDVRQAAEALKAIRYRAGAMSWSLAETGQQLVESVGFRSMQSAARAAARHSSTDVDAERRLLDLLGTEPVVTIAAAAVTKHR